MYWLIPYKIISSKLRYIYLPVCVFHVVLWLYESTDDIVTVASKEKTVVTQVSPVTTAQLMDEAALNLARAARDVMPSQQADLAIRITQLEKTEQHLRSQVLRLQDALTQRDQTIAQLQQILEQEKRKATSDVRMSSAQTDELQTLRASIAALNEALRRKDGMKIVLNGFSCSLKTRYTN